MIGLSGRFTTRRRRALKHTSLSPLWPIASKLTLKQRLRTLAPGVTPRAVLEKFSTIQMVDVHLPTTNGRHLILPRYTQPEPDHNILLQQLKLELPDQPPPKISSNAAHASEQNPPLVVPTF